MVNGLFSSAYKKMWAMSPFKAKDYSKPEHVKTVCGGGKKQSEESVIKSIRNLFKLKKENEAVKEGIIRDIMTFLIKKMITKLYLRDIIINLQKSDTWKIQLTIAINFISSKDDEEELVMCLKSNSIVFMLYDNANEVANELFESFLSRYQFGLEILTRGSEFISDSAQLLYYKCHKIILKMLFIYRFSRLDKKKQ